METISKWNIHRGETMQNGNYNERKVKSYNSGARKKQGSRRKKNRNRLSN